MTPPRFWYDSACPAPLWARALSRVYAGARKLHVLMTRPTLSPIPTICVGNVTVGGAGKTPVVRALRYLLASHRPVVLMRGYGGTLAGPVWVTPEHTPTETGDEPLLHHRDGPVIVARNRLAGAQMALRRNTKLLVMDDGLQNREITASLNLLVVDGGIGFGNARLLPAGPLREPLETLWPRIQGVVLIGEDRFNARATIPNPIPVFTARVMYDTHSLSTSTPYWAFAGIARPEKFYAALHTMGYAIAHHQDFPDHHAYTPAEIADLIDQARARGARLITTEKDIVKIPPAFRDQIDVLPLRVVFDAPDSLSAFISPYLPLMPEDVP